MQVQILFNEGTYGVSRHPGPYHQRDRLSLMHLKEVPVDHILVESHRTAREFGYPDCGTQHPDDPTPCWACDGFTNLILARVFLAGNAMLDDTSWLDYPEHFRSLSVGDVIVLDGDTFAIRDDGYDRLPNLPLACRTCGWQYDDTILSLTAAGWVEPDPWPTHSCTRQSTYERYCRRVLGLDAPKGA